MHLRDIERAAREQGWEVGSGTPSDHRALCNLLAELKRQGFIWPWPPKKGER